VVGESVGYCAINFQTCLDLFITKLFGGIDRRCIDKKIVARHQSGSWGLGTV